MPVISVDWWKGNDRARRQELVGELTACVSRIAGCPEDAVTVIVRDVDPDHWGKGEQARRRARSRPCRRAHPHARRGTSLDLRDRSARPAGRRGTEAMTASVGLGSSDPRPLLLVCPTPKLVAEAKAAGFPVVTIAETTGFTDDQLRDHLVETVRTHQVGMLIACGNASTLPAVLETAERLGVSPNPAASARLLADASQIRGLLTRSGPQWEALALPTGPGDTPPPYDIEYGVETLTVEGMHRVTGIVELRYAGKEATCAGSVPDPVTGDATMRHGSSRCACPHLPRAPHPAGGSGDPGPGHGPPGSGRVRVRVRLHPRRPYRRGAARRRITSTPGELARLPADRTDHRTHGGT